MEGRVLIVAGSDSGGGAGVQADIKTVTSLGGYAATAITALTAQNTMGVFGIVPVDPEFVAQQMQVVLEDIGADAVKTGMLHSAATIKAVAGLCRRLGSSIPIVVDPVMIAKGGQVLLERDAQRALLDDLIPLCALVTPNAPEAAVLSGLPVRDHDHMAAAADRLLGLGAAAVLVKGGHIEGAYRIGDGAPTTDSVLDLLRTADGIEYWFESPRIKTQSTHGTGCTLASAIAVGIAQGLRLRDAVDRAREYLLTAIKTALPLGSGFGPVNHGHPFVKKA